MKGIRITHIVPFCSALLLMVFMLTGCAKNELIPPAGESFELRHDQVNGHVEHQGADYRLDEDLLEDGITDDEEDEDESERSTKL